MYKDQLNHSHTGVSYPVNLGKPTFVDPLVGGVWPNFAEHGNPVPCGKGLGSFVRASITRAYYSNVGINYEPNFIGCTWEIASECYRFFMAVLAYYESPNPVIPFEHLMWLVEQEEYGITYLKKVRFFCMLSAMGGVAEDYDPDDSFFRSEANKYKIVDLGDFFNVRYWFFWDQTDPEDWKAMFEPVQTDPKMLEEFYNTVLTMLPDSIPEYIQEEEILLDVTGSSSLGPDGKTAPLWFNKERNNYFSSSPISGKLNFIQKCPGDTRSSLTLSVPHSNTIKLIEKQMASVAADTTFSCYVKDPDEYFKRFQDFKTSNEYFYCRDMKKDGLTKNRKLVKAVCDAFIAKHPLAPASKYMSIFDHFHPIVNGVEMSPPRGVGLGMTSAITTIIYCAMFRMTLDRCIEDDLTGNTGALFYHDDAAMGANSWSDLETIKDYDMQVSVGLGCIPNNKKSFTAQSFVLCENYSDEILNMKESYQRYLLKNIHTSVNVTHAKYNFGSLYRYVDSSLWELYAMELVNHFGYEFHPGETRDPHLCGGWIPAQYNKLDISLWAKDGYSYNANEQGATLSNMLFPVRILKGKRKFSKEIYKPPITKLFPGIEPDGSTWNKSYLLGMTQQQVAVSFTRHNKPGLATYYWNEQRRLRKEKFVEWKKHLPLLPEEFYTEVCKAHPRVDIIPCQKLWKFVDVSNYPECSSLYRPENPRLQFLKSLFPDKLPKNIIPWGVPPDKPHFHHRQSTALDRTVAKSVHSFFPGWTHNWGELQLVQPTIRAIWSNEWFDPLTVSAFVEATTGSKDCIVKGRVNPDLNKYQSESVFFLLHKEPWHLAIPLLTKLIGFEKVKNLDFTYFFEEVDLILRRKQAAAMLAIRKRVLEDIENQDWGNLSSSEQHISIDSQASETSASLNDEDFFTWRTSKRNYRNWRNWYFSLIDEKVINVELAQATVLNEAVDLDYEDTRYQILDPVCQYLFEKSGGKFDRNFVPLIYRNALDSSGSEEQDIFNNPDNSSDSGGSGLMVGW